MEIEAEVLTNQVKYPLFGSLIVPAVPPSDLSGLDWGTQSECSGIPATPPQHLPPPPRLLDQVRNKIRVKHYSIRTEQAYLDWIKRFIRFHGLKHPSTLGASQIEAFLTHLAVDRDVAAATQTQAKSALLFLYRDVLAIETEWLDHVTRARAPTHVPVVLTRDEVHRVMLRLKGTHRLLGHLLYGSGLRIMEGVRLRVKDVEFEQRMIIVRDGKGANDRITMLPDKLRSALAAHLERVRALHQDDLRDGFGNVWLPHSLARKYSGAPFDWGWQFVFQRRSGQSIRAIASGAGTIWATKRSSVRCAKRCATRASTSPPRRTRCAIRSLRTCSNRAPTFVRCRSCWVTATSAPR